MKDEIVTIIIFCLLVTLFVLGNIAVKSRSENLIESIKKAEEHTDEDNAPKYYEKTLDSWKEKKKILFYICSHTIIMQIDENILMGYDYIRIGDKERALYSFKKAALLLEDLYEREKIRLDNIF